MSDAYAIASDTAPFVSSGKLACIASMLSPPAKYPNTSATEMRVPSMQGAPNLI